MGEWIEGREHRLAYNPRPYALALVGTVALGSGIPRLGDDEGSTAAAVFAVLGALFAAWGVQIWLRWPTVVVVQDDGLVFRSRLGDRRVAWSDIEAVRVSHGRYGGGIRWTMRPGPSISTGARFSDVHQLLVAVERCAPEARVEP